MNFTFSHCCHANFKKCGKAFSVAGNQDKAELVSRYTWVYTLIWIIALGFALLDVLPPFLEPGTHFAVMLSLCAVLRVVAFGTNSSYLFSL